MVLPIDGLCAERSSQWRVSAGVPSQTRLRLRRYHVDPCDVQALNAEALFDEVVQAFVYDTGRFLVGRYIGSLE